MNSGYVHLYTGGGGGKTTAALGVALRALGHGQRVVILQFMKGRPDIGEVLFKKKAKGYEIRQFGRKQFVNLEHPSKADAKLARAGLAYAKRALRTKPDVLILDEINLAAAIGMIKPKEVVALIKSKPRDTSIYLTGRYAPYELIEAADFATEMVDLKRKATKAQRGIEF